MNHCNLKKIMKNIFLIILIFSGSITYSQKIYKQKIDKRGNSKDINWNNKINLSYSPINSISKIGFSPKKLNSEQQAVEFTFITKMGSKALNLKNIILKASSNKTIDINNPVRDSTYYLSDGSLLWNIIHYLNKSQLDFIKKETIKEIIITVENQPLEIRLAKKSQTLFRENF